MYVRVYVIQIEWKLTHSFVYYILEKLYEESNSEDSYANNILSKKIFQKILNFIFYLRF